ncbi:MAG: thiamine phosphate synthase [Fibrobacteria bacterium]|nr:thiamine phosphate synthase [Fibrobacteria bacterium]
MISPLHYLTQDMDDRSHVFLAEQACRGGVEWVQLRVKNKPTPDWKQIAREVRAVCDKYNVRLIINDNIHIALETGADGVHLGQKDMPVEKARQIAGDKFIIGGTANTASDIEGHIAAGADYIGIGPFCMTETKKNLSPILGVEGIGKLAQLFPDIPLIAIGGIRQEDTPKLLKTGIYGVAVSSAINKADNPVKTVKDFLDCFSKRTMI